VLILLREGCIQLLERDHPVGSVAIGVNRDSLLALVSKALPHDADVTRLRAAPPDSAGDLPKYGQQVAVDTLPEAISKVPPAYPDAARNAGVSGTVVVMALVDRYGSVKDIRIQKSIPKLDAAAMQCVRQWRFKPARSGGRPVAVWVAVPLKFTLH
jgi:protein TonB